MKSLNNYTKYFAGLIIALSVFTFCLAGYKTFMALTHPLQYKDEIMSVSSEYNISPTLIASMINVESSYRVNVRSSKGACGLMQIKVSTANYVAELYNLNEVSEEKLFDAETNIKYGTLYLKYLIDKFDDIYTALASYNAGETIVRSWLNDGVHSVDGKTLSYIPYDETRNYVEKIKNNMNFYTKIYE